MKYLPFFLLISLAVLGLSVEINPNSQAWQLFSGFHLAGLSAITCVSLWGLKQLPSKAEMDALLSDINQAGLGRSLQFDLFRPGQIAVKDYYAELPIAIKVSGRYHDIGAFASDIANLSRIVTLNNLTISPKGDGTLVLDSTAKTFRYLDKDEVAAQSKANGKGSKR